jgi:hypothetical protein
MVLAAALVRIPTVIVPPPRDVVATVNVAC